LSALLFAALASACADSAGGPPAPDASDATASENATAAGADFERTNIMDGDNNTGRDLVTLRNDLAATVFAALAAVTPPVADGAASVASGSNVTCRSEAGAVTCTLDVLESLEFSSTTSLRQGMFFDGDATNAIRSIKAGLLKLPGMVDNGVQTSVGPIRCIVAPHPNGITAEFDTCVVTY
jgi:hypothetical protein